MKYLPSQPFPVNRT